MLVGIQTAESKKEYFSQVSVTSLPPSDLRISTYNDVQHITSNRSRLIHIDRMETHV